MALKSIYEIGSGKPLNPESESMRLTSISLNRRLYNGDFAGYDIGTLPSSVQSSLLSTFIGKSVYAPNPTVNWFRRTATFYPEFLLSSDVKVEIDDVQMQKEFNLQARHFFQVMQRANIDMLRFGYGVVASHPLDPLMLQEYEPDQHYEVVNEMGVIMGDILAYYDSTYEVYNVVTYPVMGGASWHRYKSDGFKIGAYVNSIPIYDRVGRQVVRLDHNKDQVSIFADMIPPMLQAQRVAIGLAKTLKRNFSPHLYGPDSMLRRDANGNYTIDSNGMFFPLMGDDPLPGYLQWDSNIEAARWSYQKNVDTALNFAGLSPLLFDPSIQTGTLSGEALRRTLAPFLARLGHYSEVNNEAIMQLLALWNNNRQAVGKTSFNYDETKVLIDWHYEEALGIIDMENVSNETRRVDAGAKQIEAGNGSD